MVSLLGASGQGVAGGGGPQGATLPGVPSPGCPCPEEGHGGAVAVETAVPEPRCLCKQSLIPWLLQEGGEDRRSLACSLSASKIVFSCIAFVELP